MNELNIAERKRLQARERQRAKRERERKHREAMEVSELRMELYRGTREALERVCKAGQFNQPAELLTLMIHNMDELAERDPSRFAELIKVRCHA